MEPLEFRFGLRLYYAGTEDCHPGHAWGGLRDHWLFHLVHRGQGRVTLGGTTVALGPGEGFLVAPDTEVQYQADGLDPWSYTWVACAGPVAEVSFAACGLGAGQPWYRSGDPEFYRPGGGWFRRVATLMAPDDLFVVTAGLFGALADLKRAGRSSETGGPQGVVRPADLYWNAVQDCLRTTFSRPDTRVEAWATRIGITRKYLSEVVKQRCGTSPRALLTAYRLDRARVLLRSTGLGIGGVAASVGYRDQLAFSRAFHRAYGLSPTAWRLAPRP